MGFVWRIVQVVRKGSKRKRFTPPHRSKRYYIAPQLTQHRTVVQLTGSALPLLHTRCNNRPTAVYGSAVPGLNQQGSATPSE